MREILKRTHSEAFLQKMKPVGIFNEFYTKTPCLIGEGILETHENSDKNFALVRVFVDLSVDRDQPYIIFINKTENIMFLDLVSRAEVIEKIAENHEQISNGHLIYGVGLLKHEGQTIILQREKKNDNLVAALLWAADFESNLSIETGLSLVKQLLCPGRQD
jgi:hypothetical protein